MRVALVHYWLVNMRGGEKVLEALANMFPQADIFTHVYNPSAMPSSITSHQVHTTFIHSLPFSTRLYPNYLPLMPLALEQLDLRSYDLVISSESGPAKGVLTNSDTPHICYCHSPMRYLWDFYQDYLSGLGWFPRTAMRCFSHHLRMWDALSAQRVDYFAANSHNIAKRIHKHYRRNATVIYPPVDTERFVPMNRNYPEPEPYYLCFGQLVRYKRVDLAVQACSALEKKLVVIGEGPEKKKIQQLASNCVTFLDRQDVQTVINYVQRCKALLFPGEEDFGIVPLEVMAAGRPVIAYGKGGACETVIHEKTGLLFTEQSVESLICAIETFEHLMTSFDALTLTAHAEQFSGTVFTNAMRTFIHSCIEDHKHSK